MNSLHQHVMVFIADIYLDHVRKVYVDINNNRGHGDIGSFIWETLETLL